MGDLHYPLQTQPYISVPRLHAPLRNTVAGSVSYLLELILKGNNPYVPSGCYPKVTLHSQDSAEGQRALEEAHVGNCI